MNAFLSKFDNIVVEHPFKMTISTDGRCFNVTRQGGFREIRDYKGDSRLEKDDSLKYNPIIEDFDWFAKKCQRNTDTRKMVENDQ